MPIDYTRRGPAPSAPEPERSGSTGPTPTAPEPNRPAGGKIDFSRPGRGTPPPAAPPAPPADPPAAQPPVTQPAVTRPSAPLSTTKADQPPPRPAQPPISLSKVTLTKSAPSVSLTKRGQSQGTMRVNLNWQSKAPGKGFMAKLAGTDSIDLDLGCLYELTDGSKGGIQALGRSFGNLQRAPYIMLDGDDRSGASVGGENLLINLEQPGRFKRILIFAMIYQGATKWSEANGVVTLYPTAGPEIEVRLDGEGGNNARVCSIALLENQGGDLVVKREVRYIAGSQKKLDEAYGWGLSWAPGSK